jgi:hypothetical protein
MAIAVIPQEPKDRWTFWDYVLAAVVAAVVVLFVIGLILSYVLD